MKVLVVEDNAKLSLAMKIRLKSNGYTVDSSPDAISAMTSAINFKPDVVLIDINLPGGDGFTVAERMLASAETSSTPFIFMTASKEEGLRQKAEALGAMGYLEKPFSASYLFDAIGLCSSERDSYNCIV